MKTFKVNTSKLTAVAAIERSIKIQEHHLKEYIEDGKWLLAATTESYISGLQVALEIVKDVSND